MSMKGFLTNFWQMAIKVGDPLLAEIRDKQQYVSITQQAEGIYGLRTTPKGLGLVSSLNPIDAADPNNILSINALPITGHTLKEGDVIRFAGGPASGQEAVIIAASDPNWVAMVGLSIAPALGDLYSHLTPITPTTDLNGNVQITAAPTQVVDILDTPLLDPSVTNIPRSSVNAVQIVAATAAVVTEMQFIHDIGEPMNLYLDAAKTLFLCHVPLTPDEKVPCNIPAGSSIFIGASKDVDITDASSFLEINFIG